MNAVSGQQAGQPEQLSPISKTGQAGQSETEEIARGKDRGRYSKTDFGSGYDYSETRFRADEKMIYFFLSSLRKEHFAHHWHRGEHSLSVNEDKTNIVVNLTPKQKPSSAGFMIKYSEHHGNAP